MNLYLLLLLVFAQSGAKPPLTRDDRGFLTLAVPREVLDAADFRKRLYSGLTTSIELVTEVKSAGVTNRSFCLLEIRYEIWEETLIVRKYEANRTITAKSFGSLDELVTWLARTPLLVAPLGDGAKAQSISVKVQCRIIPFSQAEELQTKEWFSNVLSVPDAGQRGQQDRERERGLTEDQTVSGIFDVLMTTSIQRRSVRTFKWKWRLLAED